MPRAPSSDIPRHDFEFSELNQWTESDAYCITGKLRNSGNELRDYLLIAAVLYDSQENVINFGDYEEFSASAIEGDRTSDFEICVYAPFQEEARYEMQAWGR